MELSLVVMAAGMGSRFGGLKQIEPVGMHGESIADFSVYDAKRAGFSKVVFVIKREIEEVFREKVFGKIAKHMDAACVFQEIDDIPAEFGPISREKPWGTGQAILCCRDEVKGSFAVINADDFYGSRSYRQLHDFLADPKNGPETAHYCMVGYELGKTLTEHGTVSRGLCTVDEQGYLTKVEELRKIKRDENGIHNANDDSTTTALKPGDTVSMNAWGFTPRVFDQLEEGFVHFLRGQRHDPKAEYYMQLTISGMLAEKRATVEVLPSDEQWYGVTYKEDLEAVRLAVRGMIGEGRYPERLWGA